MNNLTIRNLLMILTMSGFIIAIPVWAFQSFHTLESANKHEGSIETRLDRMETRMNAGFDRLERLYTK